MRPCISTYNCNMYLYTYVRTYVFEIHRFKVHEALLAPAATLDKMDLRDWKGKLATSMRNIQIRFIYGLYVYTYMHPYKHISVYIHACILAYTYIRTYSCTHVRTYMHRWIAAHVRTKNMKYIHIFMQI